MYPIDPKHLLEIYFSRSRELYQQVQQGASEEQIAGIKKEIEDLHLKLKTFDDRDPASLILD
jgi:hypothetical protein